MSLDGVDPVEQGARPLESPGRTPTLTGCAQNPTRYKLQNTAVQTLIHGYLIRGRVEPG